MDRYNDFNIQAGQAFYKDKILIYQLYVINIPKKATISNLTAYFKKFGEVLKVRFLGKGEYKKCFVHFNHPNAAAEALKQARHSFMHSVLCVKPSDSLYQPDGQLLVEQLNKYFATDVVAENKTNQNALILTLNDDCLELICKKLPPKDQINFALACQRFCSVLIMVSKVEYALLNTYLFDEFSQLQTRNFLQIVGPQVKSLVSIDMKESTSRFVASFCKNVEKLILYYWRGLSSIHKLTKKMHKIQELELFGDGLDNNFIKYLQKFKNLKCLDVSSHAVLTGKNMDLLCGLENLILRDCSSLTSCNFRNICKNLKNLHNLDISGCDSLGTEDYEYISKYLVELETLNFSFSKKNFSCLAQLPKLKQLDISSRCSGDIFLAEEFFKNLAQFQNNKLEKLTMNNCGSSAIVSTVAKLQLLKILNYDCQDNEDFLIFSQLKKLEQLTLRNCYSITDEEVLKLLENCLQLVNLCLFSCNNLTPNLIGKALKLLQEQRTGWLRTDPVHIKFHFNDQYSLMNSKWNAEVMDSPQDVLKITIDNTNYDVDNDDAHDDDDDDVDDEYCYSPDLFNHGFYYDSDDLGYCNYLY